MFEIIKAGGWLMLPIIACSIIAVAICVERLLALRARKIAPPQLLGEVWAWVKNNQLDANKLRELKQGSPLGLLLATGLTNARHGREIMKESLEESAAVVVYGMERYLNALGTVALIAPMLGLVGSVMGIMNVFNEIRFHGTGDPGILAGGISEALITTASGLIVAIPATVMHRFFNGRITSLVLMLEQETLKLVDALHGDRKVELKEIR
ncbi:MAG TPA: MotA/TolQ/ExbB proton channel family protein [Spongiibacteraceae bacterium]|nr:MotA/TolQ/ExbB proton channel family protein [Spongiibacteraceae bacterium]